MLTQPHTLTKGVAAVLAACALLPAAAGAVPADNQTAGPPKVVHQTPRSLAAPDNIDRVATNPAPVWPNGPVPHVVSTATASKATAPSNDGSDLGLILGLSGGALLIAGGAGLMSRKHVGHGQPA